MWPGPRRPESTLDEQGGRSASGEAVERTSPGRARRGRDDQPETADDQPGRNDDTRLDGTDSAGDEKDDVVVVVVVVEPGNPHRIRRAGVGDRRQDEQGAQEQDSDRCPAAHRSGPYDAAGARASASAAALPHALS